MSLNRVTLFDITILTLLAIGAGCGLVYEYLLSHYAGRVLGTMEVAIYGIVTIMLISMGAGSFLSRKIADPYTGFAWLELLLALLGGGSILIIGGVFALSHLLPQQIATTFALPPDLTPSGGFILWMEGVARTFPYLFAALLGLLIGMEIPLIGRIRAELYADQRRDNPGVIYGVDYIGAGIGAILWLLWMITMEVTTAAALTASLNLLLGLIFWWLFREKVRGATLLLGANLLVAVSLLQLFDNGQRWSNAMEEILYKDHVILQQQTRYQRLVVTERFIHPAKPPLYTFYINGRTQFASNDEFIYHALLTYPAMAAAARHEQVLIIGGGDGLALRDLLRWNPQQVTLIDLDPDLVALFRDPILRQGTVVNQPLLAANKGAFDDPRVKLHFGDAFTAVDPLLAAEAMFDVIIVDLPDPGHPDLNRLYSSRFYGKLYNLLAGDGVIAIQSTSPYHARNTFICIGKTVKESGFSHVEQYHHNVPSFGEWGWTIATKEGRSPRQRLQQLQQLPLADPWLTRGVLLATFEFGKDFYVGSDAIKINHLGTMTAYHYHHQDWMRDLGSGYFQQQNLEKRL
ncbi:MAG: polyamine aminopropyltransferase [Gammaproteobacteria bacterium]|nr:polyamine aminopropyltransferase [Gammaproteobacteria bacterium]